MIVSDYLSYAIVAVLGFVTGFAFRLGSLKIHGKEVVVPFIASSSRNFTLCAIGLALLSLFTIVQVDRNNAQTTDCQVQFQTALSYNTTLTAQERDLNQRKDAVEQAARESISQLVLDITNWATTSPPPTIEQRLQRFQEYNKQSAEQKQALDNIEHERNEITAARAPYPEPKCGK
jgi:cell division protein FtsB